MSKKPRKKPNKNPYDGLELKVSGNPYNSLEEKDKRERFQVLSLTACFAVLGIIVCAMIVESIKLGFLLRQWDIPLMVLMLLGMVNVCIIRAWPKRRKYAKLAKMAYKYTSLFANKQIYTLDEVAAQTGKTPRQIKREINRQQQNGYSTKKLAKWGYECISIFSDTQIYTLEEVAAKTGQTPQQVKKEIHFLQKNDYLPNILFNEDETKLVNGRAVYELLMQQQKENGIGIGVSDITDIELFCIKGKKIIEEIIAANDALPGEEISNKLDNLEVTCTRFFAYVKQHPETLPKTWKYMDYFLPAALKLVEKYQQFEKEELPFKDVEKAKMQIEDLLDSVNDALHNFLEGLAQYEKLDVKTDIVALEKILAQEGLIGKE